ncbi:hypothetical protein DICPUDRAFT_39437, partial [Dictyostelium purpureum]
NENEYNILLLGLTGSGKSSFINAASNYLNFNSLEEAMYKGNVEDMFTVKPTKINMTDSKFQNHSFTYGGIKSSNEQPGQQLTPDKFNNEKECESDIKWGESETKSPKKYKVKYNDRTFCLIDTNGLCDTRGQLQDVINFEMILAEISSLKYLHGICLFMKPNDSRSTLMFKWCLNELLTKLHQSAKQNIFFIFPFSRGSFYRGSDTTMTLRSYLKQLSKEMNIEIDSTGREFYFDNDALHFLAVSKNGGFFYKEEELQYHESWTRSSLALKRLFTKIINTPPHDVRNTISINYARVMILELAKPISVCLKNINDNLREINSHKKTLRKSLHHASITNNDHADQELKDYLYTPIIKIQSQVLDRPKSVCKNQFCIEKENHRMAISGDANNVVNYRFCCGNCFGGIFGSLYLCFTYDINGKCKSCYKANGTLCHHSDHVIIRSIETRYQVKQPHIFDEPTSIFSVGEQNNILNQDKENIKKSANELIKKLKERKSKYEKELKIITDATVSFSLFLYKHSLMQFNHEYENYIEFTIKNETDTESIQTLTRHLENYKQQVEKQLRAIEDNSFDIGIKPKKKKKKKKKTYYYL